MRIWISQCCGAATFLCGSGSGSLRSRSWLHLRPQLQARKGSSRRLQLHTLTFSFGALMFIQIWIQEGKLKNTTGNYFRIARAANFWHFRLRTISSSTIPATAPTPTNRPHPPSTTTTTTSVAEPEPAGAGTFWLMKNERWKIKF